MKAIKAVLIDLDDTLYDYQKCNQPALEAVINKLSKDLGKPENEVKNALEKSRKELKRQLGSTASSHSRFLYFQKTIESLKGHTDIDLTKNIHRLFWDIYLDKMKLSDGVVGFLEFLKNKKIKIAVVTDLTTEIQFEKIARLGIGKYIDFIVTSEEAGSDKPGERIFMLAFKKLGVTKEEVVMVGDDVEKDAKGAKRLGLAFILVKKGDFRGVLNSFKNFNTL